MVVVNSVHVLVCYFFLNLSKIDISENLRFLAQSFSASCVLTCPVESKPNSKMIKMKTIDVVLMAFSIIGKKSTRRGRRAEHQSTDSRRRTRTKRSRLIPNQLSLSSRYFLKRSKIDISQKREIPARLQCTGPRGSLSGARSSDCGFLLRYDRFEDRHFTEREGFFRHEVRRSTRSGLMFKNAALIGRLGKKNASVRNA